MELFEAEVAARLSVGDREIAFCSDECLRRFVALPTITRDLKGVGLEVDGLHGQLLQHADDAEWL
jgi:hypothetical protein